MSNIKYTIDQVKSFINISGYCLLSTEYINNVSKLKICCPEQHIFEMSLSDFRHKHRCPICTNCKKHTIEEFRQHVSQNGYTLISTEYKNARSNLITICPKGHEYKTSWNKFVSSGYRCPICSNSNIKHTIDSVRNYIESFGYTLISPEYNRSGDKLRFQCPKGHQFDMKYQNFKSGGQRCPLCRCMKDGSKSEKEICAYVKSIYEGLILENCRKVIKNYWTNHWLELDIWMPDIRKAIEFNGDYWHKDEHKQWIDEIKKKQCAMKNIDLLVIKECKWRSNKDLCLKDIKKFINK